ncbi:MAG: hypothetical protein V3W41_11810 [Planctomycetota bacterium]
MSNLHGRREAEEKKILIESYLALLKSEGEHPRKGNVVTELRSEVDDNGKSKETKTVTESNGDNFEEIR